MDAYCHHDPPCTAAAAVGQQQSQLFRNVSSLAQRAMSYSVPLHSYDLNPHLRGAHGGLSSFPAKRVQACCRVAKLRRPHDLPVTKQTWLASYQYSLYLFEREPGDAITFFSSLYEWSLTERELVESFSPESRVACRPCRNKYALHLFLRDFPLLLDESSSPNDLLHGDFSYFHRMGYFAPSFYGGGVFDSKRVGVQARSILCQLSALRAQSLAEKAKRFAKMGPVANKQERFIYARSHDELFRRNVQLVSTSNRPPRWV